MKKLIDGAEVTFTEKELKSKVGGTETTEAFEVDAESGDTLALKLSKRRKVENSVIVDDDTVTVETRAAGDADAQAQGVSPRRAARGARMVQPEPCVRFRFSPLGGCERSHRTAKHDGV